MQRIADHLNRWPRLGRKVLVFGITLELVILLVWDALLFDLLGDDPASSPAPLWIAVILGVSIYVFGWWSLIGFADRNADTWRVGKPGAAFALVGLLGLLAVIVMLVYAVASGDIL